MADYTKSTSILKAGTFIVYNGEPTTIEIDEESGEIGFVFDFLKEEEMSEEQKLGKKKVSFSYRMDGERNLCVIKIAKLGSELGGGTMSPLKCFKSEEEDIIKHVYIQFIVRRIKDLPIVVDFCVYVEKVKALKQSNTGKDE